MAAAAQDEQVLQFQEITQIESAEAARMFLTQHSFNLDAAVQAFFQGDFEPPNARPSSPPSASASGVGSGFGSGFGSGASTRLVGWASASRSGSGCASRADR